MRYLNIDQLIEKIKNKKNPCIVGIDPEWISYVVMANQVVCVAWFSEQGKYADVFEANKRLTRWLLSVFEELNLPKSE